MPLSPLFCVRLAGVPFDVLESTGTPDLSRLARAVIDAEVVLARETEAVLHTIRGLDLPRGTRNNIRRAVEHGRPIPDTNVAEHVPSYREALDSVERARRELADRFVVEDAAARARLVEHAHAVLPDFLVFESPAALKQLCSHRGRPLGAAPSEQRNYERHFAMYLQRVCAKNDTISRFGPSSWGEVRAGERGFQLAARAGVRRRTVAIERWVVAALIAAINADPAVRSEVCPRVHPNGRLDGETFTRVDQGRAVALSGDEVRVLARVDGHTPAHALDSSVLGRLAEQGVVIWEVEPVAWDATPLVSLREDLLAWRETEPRARWLAELDVLENITQQFANQPDAEARLSLIERLKKSCTALGAELPTGRSLYGARNPIVEECERETNVVLGGDLVDALQPDIEPWIDLFRDTIALAASHCFDRLRELHDSAPRRSGSVLLAAFLAHCETNQLSMRGAGLARIAAASFAMAKREFRDALGARPDAPEWTITAEDCRVLRRRHEFPPPGAFSLASPDLQLAAASPEAVARGDYEWVVAELHSMETPLQRAIDWACSDPTLLRQQFETFAARRPWIVPSRLGTYMQSVHTSSQRMFEMVPGMVFASPERGRASWRIVAPASAEVVLDDVTRDVRVRTPEGEDLGSLIRVPWLTMGIHPFFPLETPPHTPRLRLGKTIVQRRTWYVDQSELGSAKPDATSPTQLVAIERMRAARDIPRFVYVRPSGIDVERVEVFSRDKDVKPMYVDLESTIFGDIFMRHLWQYKRLEVTEMVPNPDQLVWREPDGRYTFELRTMYPA